MENIKLNVEFPDDPVSPLLGTDPKELETGTQVQAHIGSQQHFPR